MAKPEPDWTLYRSALAVLREGSLSGAARSLGLTQPTIGRHMQALGDALGVTLFTRSLHGLKPTESLVRISPHLEALDASTAALRRALSQTDETPAGTVRITASEIIGVEVLPPVIRDLQQIHPKLVVELVISNKISDLLRRDADIAVRMVRPTQTPLLTQRIGKTRLGLYAHRDYLERYGTPTSMEEARCHRILGFDRGMAYPRQILAAGITLSRDMFSLRCDSDLAQLAALRAACGIGVCQSALAGRTPELIPILPEIRFELDVWLAMHGDLRSNRACRATFDAIGAGLRRYLRRTRASDPDSV